MEPVENIRTDRTTVVDPRLIIFVDNTFKNVCCKKIGNLVLLGEGFKGLWVLYGVESMAVE
ncbi:hypothetical protein Hanom_Chr03g00254331 [Helianthus anomalus]